MYPQRKLIKGLNSVERFLQILPFIVLVPLEGKQIGWKSITRPGRGDPKDVYKFDKDESRKIERLEVLIVFK